MAAIDKIYVNNWKDFCEVRDYFMNTEFVGINGTKCVLKNYMYDVEDITEDFFDGKREIPVTNTPCKVDYYLAMYCPVKAVQEYLNRAYRRDWKNVDEWKEYITFDRNPGNKIKVIKYPKFGKINKALNQRFGWQISVHTIRKIEYLLTKNGITPKKTQWGGMQYENNATRVKNLDV